ncbi:MAG: prepilin-type N-terminal cleavage/methylation domain-containing protein [Phycisphaerales bacterium]|nr:prepilin-type N-terminal cleavage/methylation domain-containing protein [Phycisphaerales bacterium]
MTVPRSPINSYSLCALHSCGSRAFTLLELLVVTSLMALAVGWMTLRLDSLTAAGKVRGVAAQIGAYVRLAQIEACTSGAAQVLEIDAARRAVRLGRAGCLPVAEPQAFMLTSQVDLTHVWFDSERRDVDGGRFTIRIDSHGRYRRCAWLLQSGECYAVCAFPCIQPPCVYRVSEIPRAASYDDLLVEVSGHAAP